MGFDNASDIAGGYGDNSGVMAGVLTPTLDTAVKASGSSSLKFVIPSQSGAGASGSYFANFSPDLSAQFGENSTFYVQWRQRFSPEFLNTYFTGGGGWKQAILGAGDKFGCTASTSSNGLCAASCSALETVTQNTYQRGFPQMYNSCTGSTSHGPYAPFEQPYGASDFKLENGQPTPYCLYSQGQTTPTSYFPSAGNCFPYAPNEWMTFQVMIQTGPRVNDEFTNSYVNLWVAREGKPSQLVIKWGPYNLSAASPADDQKFGKVWLLPYHTGKDATQVTPTGYVWYDELIISHNHIADPSASATSSSTPPPTTGPSVPASVDATAVSASEIDLTWTASTDNVAVTKYVVKRNGTQVGTPSATSYADTGLVSDTTYTYALAAVDAAGNVSADSPSVSAMTPLPAPVPTGGNALAALAASMAPGTWAQMPAATGFNLFAQGSITGNILPFCNSMPWDSINRKIHIIGQDHGAPTLVYLQYDADTNSFSQLTGPGYAAHGYDHNVINPTTGDVYNRVYGIYPSGNSVLRRTASPGVWSNIPDWSGTAQVAIGATWWRGPFVGGGTQGSLMLFNSGNGNGGPNDGQIVAYNPLTNSWFFSKTGVAPNADNTSTYHSVMEYSPQNNVAVYGGGNAYSNRLWRLNADGTTTPMPNTPAGTAVGIQRGNLVNDPVTGNFLLLSNGQLWELNPTGSGTWTLQTGGGTPPAAVGIPGPTTIENVISSSIDTYGVVAYITFRGTTGNFYLYKHH